MTTEDKLPEDLSSRGAEGQEPSAATPDDREMAAGEAPAAEEDVNVRLEEAESRAADYLDSLQRERAAFQNFKKRVEREREEQRRVIEADVLLKLLPIMDDFHRAISALPDDAGNWTEGVRMIQRKLERFLEDSGVTEMDVLGEEFDPAYHEAIGVDEGADAAPGTITQVMQRGYLYRDRVLRPALVRVAG